MSNQKPPFTHSITQVYSGEIIPPTFLKKLNDENRSAFGFGVREGGSLVIERFDQLSDIEKELKTQTSILDNTKKYDRMFIYGDFPTEFDEDEVQPFVAISDSKGRPILVVGLEGDFPGRNSDEGFSEAYVVMHEWLKPKLESMYKLLGNSTVKLVEYLKGPDFDLDFKNVYSNRGVLAVLSLAGKPFMVGKNEIGAKFSWGEASVAYGYSEGIAETATPIAAEPSEITKTVMRKVSKYADEVVEEPAPAKPPEPEKDKPVVEVPVPKAPPTLPAPEEFEEIDWKPPQNLHGKKLKAAYRQFNSGVLPKDWADRPVIRIRTKKTVKSLKELDQTAAAPLAQAAQVAAKAPKADAEGVENVTLPVISGEQHAKAVDFIKKHLSDSKTLDEDPLDTQKRESKLALFSELVLDSDLDNLERWPTSGIFAFVKDNPEVGALAIIELRRDRINRKATMAAMNPKLSELTGTEKHVLGVAELKTDKPAGKVSKYA